MPFLGSFLSEEQFQCSICLDIFENPVSTPCGHSFCMVCIGRYWHGMKHCQCPLCKESFKRKPELHINRTLREITEQFKQMKADAGTSGGPKWEGVWEGVLEERTPKQADLFIEMKQQFPATSLPHEGQALGLGQTLTEENNGKSPQEYTKRLSMRRYTLSGAANSAKVPLCEKHHHKLDYFCKSDGEFICTECNDTDHKSHIVISAEQEWINSKAQISITEAKIQEMIQDRMKKIEQIQLSQEKIKTVAQREKLGSIRVFGALLNSLERSQAQLLEVIEMSRRSLERQAEGMMKELELELTELRQRSTTLTKLAQTDDCISGLRSYSNLNTALPGKDWAGASVHCDLGTKSIYNSVCQLLKRFQEEMCSLPEHYLSTVTDQSPVKSNPKVKRVQEYAADVTLDPNSAHPRLVISEDGKQVKCGDKNQHVPNNPERFNRVVCVLGREGFTTGQHYWEVEVGDKTDWDLGMASRSISRKGKLTIRPSKGFWFLSLRDKTSYSFRTEPSTSLTLELKPHKIGVFVDYEKGQVSFYNVDAKMHIYTFTDTFCEAIYPFFSPCTNKSGKNYAPLTITPVSLLD